MTIESVTFRKGERPPPLSDEQKAMVANLKNKSYEQIDTSDDWGDNQSLVVTSDSHLIDDFSEICRHQHKEIGEVITQLMRSYVQQYSV